MADTAVLTALESWGAAAPPWGPAALCALLTAVLSAALLLRGGRRGLGAGRALRAETGLVFLFEGAEMIDATPRARAMLEGLGCGAGPRERLMHHAARAFDGAAEAIAALSEGRRVDPARIEGAQGALLRAERIGPRLRVEISDPAPGRRPGTLIETATLRAMEDELGTLRAAAASAPWPCWHADPGGTITWVNAAYLALEEESEAARGAPPVWPPTTLFGAVPVGAPARLEVALRRGGARAFDCRAVPTEGGAIHFAAPADAALAAERRAEAAARGLSETFAQVDLGLALFGRDGRLALHNPALAALLGLPAPFLATRPTLPALLERLREARLVPEPPGPWPARVAALEAAARTEGFRETWTLPSGRSWRVSGRPQADGAVALLFEDRTAELALARRLRGEMSLGQGLVDAMEGAVCVFDASGALALSNAEYADLWGMDPRRLTGEATFPEAVRRWRARALPTPAWDALESAAARPGGIAWEGEMLLRDGRHIGAAARPIGGGATLLRFEETGRRTPLSIVGAAPAHA